MDNRISRSNRPISSRENPSRTPSASPPADPSRSGRSPSRRKPNADTLGRTVGRLAANDDGVFLRGRWPSSKKLGDSDEYLYSEPRRGERASPVLTAPFSLSRVKSASEFSRFEEDKKKTKKKKDKYNKDQDQERLVSKENRPFGTSMRYIGKLRFNKSSSKDKPESPPMTTMMAGRMSVDGGAFTSSRKTDFGIDIPSNESDPSDISTGRGHSPKVPRARKKVSNKPAKQQLLASAAMTRTGSMPNHWAASSSPPQPPHAEGGRTTSRSFSSLRPASPERGRKVGNIISMGLDLFRRKSDHKGSDSESTKAVKTLSPSSSFTLMIGDTAHQLRLMHNCLFQWRYVNARADNIDRTRTSETESTLVSAWVGIANLRASVMHKRMQMEREKLKLKVYTILGSQIKALEGWGEKEKQHVENISTTKHCLEAAVCRLPLVDRAKADAPLLSIWFRQASSLAATMETTIGMFSPTAENTVKLLHALAHVAAQERALLEECVDAMGRASALQVREQSLRCHLVQLKSSQQHRNVSIKEIL